jgi:hypothetical protein
MNEFDKASRICQVQRILDMQKVKVANVQSNLKKKLDCFFPVKED